ncbi:MAG: hypothetical protein ACXVCM_25035 [Ktedonobacteraceae bacterium]
MCIGNKPLASHNSIRVDVPIESINDRTILTVGTFLRIKGDSVIAIDLSYYIDRTSIDHKGGSKLAVLAILTHLLEIELENCSIKYTVHRSLIE